MSRKFKLWKEPYDDGICMYMKTTVAINPGVTVLVGCNGIGKSTMLHCMEQQLKKEDIPCLRFDNLQDGGSHAISKFGFEGDYEFMAAASTSSEGENILINMNKLAARIGEFVRTGKDNTVSSRLQQAFASINKDTKEIKKQELSNERWILLDAVDSGFSVDNIIDLKHFLFSTMLKHNFGKEIYIVVSANEYEMANGEQCFDVYNGEYIIFKNYDEYREMILQSKKEKNKREEQSD